MRTRKLLVLAFAAVMLCALLPVMAAYAYAAEYDLWVGGTQITDENLTTDDWEYIPSTKTLILKDCTLSSGEQPGGAAVVSQGIDLTIEGSGVLKGEGYGIRVYSSNGAGGHLKLDVGNLTAIGKGGTSQSDDDSGILADGNITIKSGILHASGEEFGIYSKNGNIEIIAGNVTASAGTEAAAYAGQVPGTAAIYAGTISETGADTGANTNAGNITITGGKVRAENAMTPISAKGNVSVSGGEVVAVGESTGMHVIKTLTVSGGEVRIISGGHGIGAGKTVLSGGIVFIEATNGNGITGDDVSINKGIQKVDAAGNAGAILVDRDTVTVDSGLRIRKPEGGAVSEDGKTICEAGGKTPADYVVIIPDDVPDLLTITYDLNGAIDKWSGKPYGLLTDRVEYGTDLNGSAFMVFGFPGAPEGMILAGFEIEGKFIKNEVGYSYIYTHDVTVKFIWEEKNEYLTVTYDLNGGINTLTGQPYGKATDHVEQGSDLNGNGFMVFGGWGAPAGKSLAGFEIDGEYVAVVPNYSYIFTHDVTVKFIWEDNVLYHTVTYDLNGGIKTYTGEPYGKATDHVEHGSDLNGNGFMIFGPWEAPEGKKLIGFEIEGEFIKMEPDYSYIFTHDVTVKFIWDENVLYHTVTYDLNGGINSWTGEPYGKVTDRVEHGSELNGNGFMIFGPWGAPEGKKLMGFDIDGEFIAMVPNYSYIFTHDVTVKFLWDGDAVFHTITYDLNGGINNGTGLPYGVVTEHALDGTDLNGSGFMVFGGWAPPAGKTLLGFEIEGKYIKYEVGFSYVFTHDVTVKFIWDEEDAIELSPYEVYRWNTNGSVWRPVNVTFRTKTGPVEYKIVQAVVTSVLIPPNFIQFTAIAEDPAGVVHTMTWTERTQSLAPAPLNPGITIGNQIPAKEPAQTDPGKTGPTEPGTSAPVDETPALPFTDVTPENPYLTGIKYVYSSGIMNGVSPTEFAPDGTLTRAMFVTILGRMEGIDPADYTTGTFTDCDAVGTWDYAPYVEWAAQNGIVLGYGNGKFGPMDPVTNEQAVLMLQRYAKYLGYMDDTMLNFITFPEGTKVSTWAADAVAWAYGNSIYAATDGDPSDPACRGWMAQVSYNFVGYLIQ